MHDYDYIIIGSGFGGSVSALRLAEKGYSVLVVEKGKWYRPGDFPKSNRNLRKWLWIPALRFFGIMKITAFRHLFVLSGTGVGGGSLVYANTLPVPKSHFFHSGSWKGLADWEEELKPYYREALRMLGAVRNPRFYDADKALAELAGELKLKKHFEAPYVSVWFGEEGRRVSDPYFGGEGPDRAGCRFCGACMTGCRYHAKNSLDQNYLYLAQKRGARILAEHRVTDVKPLGKADGSEGYRVRVRSSTRWPARSQSFTARGVVFSAGVLGTVRLLLKLRKKSLPRLSERVGFEIRSNNETLVSVSTLDRDRDMSRGIAIGSILHTDPHSHLEPVRYGPSSDAWKWLHLPYVSGRTFLRRLGGIFRELLSAPGAYFRIYFRQSWSRKTTVLLFMQTLESTLRLKRSRSGRLQSRAEQGRAPTAFIPESQALSRKFAEIVNGKATAMISESLFGIPSTAHILGGAVMAADASKGVINKNNEVFGYKNMLVCDGSMISANPGVNPSLSIAAISERAMARIPEKKEKETKARKF